MKTRFQLPIIIFILLASPGLSQNKINVLHYSFELRLNDINDTIYGNAAIQFILKEKKQTAGNLEVVFDLKNRESGKGMSINGRIYSKNLAQPLSYRHANDLLTVKLPVNSIKSDTVEITIPYKGVPADGLIISKNKFGNRTFFSDNWPNRAHNWIPSKDDPSDKASVEFAIIAPSHYQVISNGIQVEETNLPGEQKLTRYKEDIPLPTKIMVIGVAAFAVNHTGMANNCVPVTSWVFPENKTQGSGDYAIAKNILEFYSDYIGPYPFAKLANIQSKTIFGGMENASAIFYSENSVNGLNQQEALIAHEIVHQWFGNTATEKSFAHLWLSEGFATYLTHFYLESKYGKDSLEKRMKTDRDEVISFGNSNAKPVVDSTKEFMSLLNENSYQKGSWILHMLRMQLGDSIFKAGVRRYFDTYKGSNADSRDLQKIFESVSGKNLEQFFTQWLYVNQNPVLNISWSYKASTKQLQFQIKQNQKPVFHLPLEIAVRTASGPVLLMLDLNKAEQSFSFPLPDKPVEIIPDPGTSLLFTATIKENPAN